MKNWNVLFVAGNPEIFTMVRGGDNPLKRSTALENAQTITNHGWRVWVENIKTGEIIFESDAQKEYKLNTK